MKLCLGIASLLLAVLAGTAAAQDPTPPPAGAGTPPPSAPPAGAAPPMPPPGPPPATAPTAPVPAPRGAAGQPGGQEGATGGETGGTEGFYISDDTSDLAEPDEGIPEGAEEMPPQGGSDVHVVRQGDTLWDLSQLYMRDPWSWPKMWSYNPQITNPHFIYPGDVVRLSPTAELTAAPAAAPTGEPQPMEAPATTRGIEIKQVAFMGHEDLKYAGVVDGSWDEKIMLGSGDDIYVDYPGGKPPQVGKRYSVFTLSKPIKHPRTKERVGSYVMLLGSVEILDVQKDKRARARILYSNDSIERGHYVGPLQTQFANIEAVPSTVSIETTVIGIIGPDELYGEGMLVFLDRGKADGLAVGNVLYVVRQGDAYERNMKPSTGVGLRDEDYPEAALARVIVVQVGQNASVALVTYSLKEAEVGDRAVIRKGQ